MSRGDESDALSDPAVFTSKELRMPKPGTTHKSKPKIEPIDKTFINHNQSWIYTLLCKILNVRDGSGSVLKVRVALTRNTYDLQSYAEVEVFSVSEMKWNRIIGEVYTKDFKSYGVSYVEKNPDENLFVEDTNRLLQKLFDLLK